MSSLENYDPKTHSFINDFPRKEPIKPSALLPLLPPRSEICPEQIYKRRRNEDNQETLDLGVILDDFSSSSEDDDDDVFIQEKQPILYQTIEYQKIEYQPIEYQPIEYKEIENAPIEKVSVNVQTSPKIPFQCQLCDKKFEKRRTLKSHYTLHCKVRPYICKCCNASFAQKKNFEFHERIHDMRNSAFPFMIRKLDEVYACTICSKMFGSETDVKIHLMKYHGAPLLHL